MGDNLGALGVVVVAKMVSAQSPRDASPPRYETAQGVYDMGQYCCLLTRLPTMLLGECCTASTGVTQRACTRCNADGMQSQSCSNDSLAANAKPELFLHFAGDAGAEVLETF